MSQETIIANTEVSFKDFLLKNKRNRTILWIAAAAIVLQFALFKYFYPFASFIHGDSFSYITSAYRNLTINTYPIGYSKFLRLVSIFTKSDLVLVAIQYLLIQYSVLFLLYTLFYFYNPSKFVQYALLSFMVLNPLFLHLANLVSSDNFFLTLSMIWFSLLLWIIHQPSRKIIICQTVVLVIAFTVRYNALIYPLITILVFAISRICVRPKIWGIASGLLACCLFAFFTSYRYKKLAGFWQFSPFSGWQMANNALYAYRYVDVDQRKPVPNKFNALDSLARIYFDTHRNIDKYPEESVMASTFYMWSPGMPLMKYRDSLFKHDSLSSELKKWASMGPFYKSYGLYIIRQYPWHFVRYFIWPNANKYYAPPVEFLESYNWGKDSVPIICKAWFGYESRKVKTRMKNKDVWILNFYPILSGIINLTMLCCLLCYIILKGWRHNAVFNNGVLLAAIFWLLNALFTIIASSAALRFQSFPIMLTTIFVALLIDWMVRLMAETRLEQQKEINRLQSDSSLSNNVIA